MIGGYTASYKLSEILIIFTSIFISYSPVIVRYLKRNDIIAVQRSYLSISKLLLFIIFPLFIFLYKFGYYFLSFFGNEYLNFANVLSILAVGVYFDAVTGPIGEILNMSGNEKTEMRINLVAVILNVFLIYLLTISFGLIGAALAFAVPRMLANSSKLFFVYKLLKIKTLTMNHIKILLLQILIFLLISLSNGTFISILSFTIFIIFYISVVYKFELLTKLDLKIIKDI